MVRRTPDPLEPANIAGQNPATPERLPGSTGRVPSRPANDLNEEEAGGRPAFLFRSGDAAAVTLDSSGANLPAVPSGAWVLERYFTLGVRDVGLHGMPPEPILRGIVDHGYFLWRPGDASRTLGTSQ